MTELLRMHGTSFDWLTWCNGWLDDLGIRHYTPDVLHHQETIRKYALGYIKGDEVVFRAKPDTYAVMFAKGYEQFWTHLTVKEFETIWDVPHKELEG